MYKQNQMEKTSIEGQIPYTGDTIEEKVRKILNAKEPIKDGSPLIYTERKDGVRPGFNIKTDRFEVALDAIDSIAKYKLAQREERAKAREEGKIVNMDNDKMTGGQPIQGENAPS